ncbi:gliding motility-associated-like protein [Mucilaginibacter oryzae]|uniref:Gliding motility-associated-like protein n=1 Tax=Mucilaginibacter oryzae TaxID=468058 RepID=A0A316HIK1_9SPHI|nr:gliding motility-associated C-terminal domain-containing protein [Mucilaginibacter oryzae]PWK73765.1 gliding motility-associated-like protein [Mucilaginibacter oryzae]
MPSFLYKPFLWAIFGLLSVPLACFSGVNDVRKPAGSGFNITGANSGIFFSRNLIFFKHHIVSQPAPVQAITICSAAAAVLNGDVQNHAPDSFLWQVNSNGNWVSAPGGNKLKDYITSSLTNGGASSIVYSLRRRTITAGVTAFDSYYDVTVRPIRSVTNNGISAPSVTRFCSAGDPASITGSAPAGGDGTFVYQWQSSTDNINFTDINGAGAKNYDPPVLSKNTYYRRMVSSGACTTPTVSNAILFSVSPLPPQPTPTASQVTVCTGNPATLAVTALAGFTYKWYDSPAKTVVLSTSNTYTTPVLNANKTYYIEASDGSCGSSLATILVNVTSLPAAPQFDQTNIKVCKGSAKTISIKNAQSGVDYQWLSSPTGGLVFKGSSLTISNVPSPITYYVRGVNSTTGCTSPTLTAISVTPVDLPVVTSINAGGVSVCPGTKATLTATVTGDNSIISWYDAATGGNLLAKGPTYVTPGLNAAKTYYVEATNTGGCTSNTRVAVPVTITKPLNAPVVTAGEVTASSVTFKWDAVPGATTYQVSTDNGTTYKTPSSGANGLSHTISGLDVNEAVTITVKALGATDCTLSDASAAVTATTIDNNNLIFVANNFTPNADGNNDVVYVHGKNIKTMSFYVYDQWGQQMFTTTDITRGWDGYFKGSLMPVGVYVYYLKAVMNNGEQLTKKGTITLLR